MAYLFCADTPSNSIYVISILFSVQIRSNRYPSTKVPTLESIEMPNRNRSASGSNVQAGAQNESTVSSKSPVTFAVDTNTSTQASVSATGKVDANVLNVDHLHDARNQPVSPLAPSIAAPP